MLKKKKFIPVEVIFEEFDESSIILVSNMDTIYDYDEDDWFRLD